jgi:putative ABC transport system permease protein
LAGPDWKPEIRRRLAGLKLAPTRETSIVEELAQHLDDFYQERLSGGATPAAAEIRTRAELSGHQLLAQELRRVERKVAPDPITPGINRRANMIADLWQDLRFGARMLWKKPGFTLVAALTLSLGIGANTAIFSFVNTLLLRSLPYPEPSRLVAIESINPQQKEGGFGGVSPADFWDWKDQSQAFEQLTAYVGDGVSLTDRDQPEMISVARVSSNFFQTLGVAPSVGRAFTSEEGFSNGPRAIVISHRLWSRRFNGDPTVVGRTVKTATGAVTIAGVAPPDFKLPLYADAWTPLERDSGEMQYRNSRYMFSIGRIKPGVSVSAAEAEMKTIAGRLAETYPKENRNWSVKLTPLAEYQTRNSKRSLLVLMGAVALVLLIACANIANLLLTAAAARRKEMAVRLALGASRGRLLRQLLAESLLLGLAGGAGGLLLAFGGVKALIYLFPPHNETYKLAGDVRVDGASLVFTLLIAVLTGLIFGLAPGWQASRPALNHSLKEGGRGFSSAGQQRTRALLVISEIALALLLLVGAGLLMNSFLRMRRVDVGYDPRGLMKMPIGYLRQNKSLFLRQAREEISRIPGIESVGVMSFWTFGGLNFPFNRPDRPLPNGDVTSRYSAVSPDYFRTMKTPMRAGREFNERDTPQTPGVAIINETLAKTFFAGEDPIGKQIVIAYLKQRLTREIVGVAADIKQDEPSAPTKPEILVPFEQLPWFGANLVIRTKGPDPLSLEQDVKRAILSVNKEQTLSPAVALEQALFEQVAEPRLYTTLLGVFAILATLLAAVGIYGVMSFAVTQRAQEIGVRMALGAQRRDVLKLVVGQGMALAALGTAVGLVAAIGLTRLLSSQLFGVSATDPLTFAAVALGLIGVALAACYLPARRATKVDPMNALRYE